MNVHRSCVDIKANFVRLLFIQGNTYLFFYMEVISLLFGPTHNLLDLPLVNGKRARGTLAKPAKARDVNLIACILHHKIFSNFPALISLAVSIVITCRV